MMTLPPLMTRGAMVIVYAMFAGRNARFPNFSPVCGVERAQPSVDDRRDDLVLIQRDAAIHHAAANARLPDLLIHLRDPNARFPCRCARRQRTPRSTA